MRVAGRRPQNGECGSGQRFSQKRRTRRGYARHSSVSVAWPDKTQRPGKNRARLNKARTARALDRLEPLAHLAWPSPLLRAQAGLLKLRGISDVPQLESFPAHTCGEKAGRQAGLTGTRSAFDRVHVA